MAAAGWPDVSRCHSSPDSGPARPDPVSRLPLGAEKRRCARVLVARVAPTLERDRCSAPYAMARDGGFLGAPLYTLGRAAPGWWTRPSVRLTRL